MQAFLSKIYKIANDPETTRKNIFNSHKEKINT